ncbi:MAG: hypothetical protein HKN84_05875 [Gammaproteobacteria bacterium]|nr:hypothetical protein [Gammaproteobacteria bacterium]
MAHYVIHASRLLGYRAPAPEYVPLAGAARIAAWLAEARANGPSAWLNTNAASAVRVAMAAKEMGLDISGSLFRCGGEPLTPGKEKVIEDSGCRVVCHYSMGEIGRIGIACAKAQAVDDVHVLSDKIAVIRHAKPMTPKNEVLVNFYTTLLATPPKLMLNVESGDHGVLERRSCGCVWDRLGYNLHFHTIRSYEKLTSEGMNFLGSGLIQLVEEVLPEHFGGYPTDYQFVEVEEDGLPKVELVVSPRVGKVSESDIVTVVLQYLDRIHGQAGHYGDPWREAKTLRVTRQEPYATGSSKVLALHVPQLKSP